MQKDLLERVQVAIKTLVAQTVEDYLEDITEQCHKDQQLPYAVLQLVTNLKYWSNLDASYQPQLPLSEYHNFKNIVELLQHPHKILSQEQFTKADEAEILNTLKKELDAQANHLIFEHHLEQAIEQNRQLAPNEISSWWRSKSNEERKYLQQKYQALSKKEKQEIEHVVHHYYPQRKFDTTDYIFLWMMLDHQRHYYYNPWIIPSCNTLPYPSSGYSSLLSGLSRSGGYSSSIGQGGGKDIGIVIAAIAFGTIAISGIIGGAYATMKCLKSLYNLVHDHKVTRSLVRLTGAAIGGVAGGFFGSSVAWPLAVTLFSCTPMTAMVVTGIFCAGIGAGALTLITKYTARIISKHRHPNALNPTNPEKYQLTPREEMRLHALDFNLDDVKRMIRALHKLGHVVQPSQKRFCNQLLSNLKHHPERLRFPIKINDEWFNPIRQYGHFGMTPIYNALNPGGALPNNFDAVKPSAPTSDELRNDQVENNDLPFNLENVESLSRKPG